MFKMRKVELEELKKLAIAAHDEIWLLAKHCKREPKIYLHWSAGKYDDKFENCHINITGNGDIYINTEDLSDVISHTYHRNYGAVGVSLCCGYHANTKNLGSYKPTSKQIEVISKVVEIIADALSISIDKKHVLTHGEAADNEDGLSRHEPYGPKTTVKEWDLEYLGNNDSPKYNPHTKNKTRGGDIIRRKANWYHTHV